MTILRENPQQMLAVKDCPWNNRCQCGELDLAERDGDKEHCAFQEEVSFPFRNPSWDW